LHCAASRLNDRAAAVVELPAPTVFVVENSPVAFRLLSASLQALNDRAARKILMQGSYLQIKL
jgi:hypothetical protein